jgi:hypothetical protein
MRSVAYLFCGRYYIVAVICFHVVFVEVIKFHLFRSSKL